jgi:crossover junction endodeoxyribonuclease RuvC
VRVLGIDPGSRVCGYGLIDAEGSRLSYVECGVVQPQRDSSLAHRLAEVWSGLREVVAELKPQVVAVEGVFVAGNARTALALGHARGVALCVAGEASLEVVEYAPALVKRTVSGYGRASKGQVARVVGLLLGLNRLPRADAADALAVALTHARLLPRRALAASAPRSAKPTERIVIGREPA